MPETAKFTTLARGPRGGLILCNDCHERIEVGPDVWVPDHECEEGQ